MLKNLLIKNHGRYTYEKLFEGRKGSHTNNKPKECGRDLNLGDLQALNSAYANIGWMRESNVATCALTSSM